MNTIRKSWTTDDEHSTGAADTILIAVTAILGATKGPICATSWLPKFPTHVILTFLLLVSLLVNSTVAVVTSDEPGSHVVTPGKPSFGINTDGVVMIGMLSDSGVPDSFCSGALISDRHVLSAAHCFDSFGTGEIDDLTSYNEVIFELQDGLVAIEYEVESILWPDQWLSSRGDLAVVTLTEDAPASVPRYPLYGAKDEVGQSFVLVGYGQPGHGSSGEVWRSFPPVKRAGLNRFEDIYAGYPEVDFLMYDFDNGLPENNLLQIVGVESDLGFGEDEVFLGSGDSGGPSFLGGAIAAVNAFTYRHPEADVTSFDDSSWGEAGFNTRVSGFREFILVATGGTAVFVPEPSSLLLVAWGVTLGISTTRRKG